MKVKVAILTLILVLIGSYALANEGSDMVKQVIGGGASDATTGGGTSMRATLGQPLVGVVASSDDSIRAGQGFWHGGLLSAGHGIYLPLVVR